MDDTGKYWGIGCAAAVVIFLLIAIGMFLSGASVDAGHVGIVTTWGKVEPGELQPGFHMIQPFAQSIHQVDTRVQPHTFQQIDASSKEYQSVRLSGTMNYHLDSTRVNVLYSTVGLDFAPKIIDPAFSDFVKEVVPTYGISEILPNRDKIRSRAKTQLGDNLHRYGIIVDDIYIKDIQFSPEYTKAIESKQVASQQVETEKQVLAQKNIQAQQAVIDAHGKADASVVAAEGQAKANALLNASLTDKVLQYIYLNNVLFKWDGKLPTYTGGGQPFLSLPSKAN